MSRVVQWILSAALVSSLAACASTPRHGPGIGEVVDGRYENAYFEFELMVPEGWSIARSNALAELLDGEGEDANPRSHNLFLATAHPLGTPVRANPTVLALAEDVSELPGIRDGADYLFHLIGLVAQSAETFESVGDAKPVRLGGVLFHRQDVWVNGQLHSFVARRSDEFVLVFLLQQGEGADLAEVHDVLGRIHFRSAGGADTTRRPVTASR